jgi:hypothetical protein
MNRQEKLWRLRRTVKCPGGSTSGVASATLAQQGRENTYGMQRVRIGLTGLAFVFLLVLLGAVFRSASDEEPITANSVEHQLAQGSEPPANKQQAEPTEALAELGVAPGNADTNTTASAANSEEAETVLP